jgi:hypothetical protein
MEIQTEAQRELLCLTVSGEVDVNSCVRIMVKALDEAAEKHIYKILVNALLMTGTLTMTDRHDLGARVASHILNLGTNPKVAFVGTQPMWNGFGVTIAQNRGAIVQWFHTVQDAREWLSKWPNPA